MKYKIFVYDLPFMFLTNKDLLAFLEGLFSNCIERRKLYDNLMHWNSTILYQSCFNENISEKEQMPLFTALEILEESYGKFYDPERVLFNSHHKIKYN